MRLSVTLIALLISANLLCAQPSEWVKAADSLRDYVIDNPENVVKNVDIYIRKALAAKDSLGYARLLDTRGMARRNLGKYADAIEDHKTAYDIYYRLNHRRGMAGSMNSIAIIMIRNNKFSEAIEYLNNAVNYTAKDDTAMLSSIYINMGVCYDYSDKQELAIETYKKALPFVIAKKDDYGIGVVLHDIAVCYSVLRKYKESEEYEFRAMKYQEKCGNKDLLARIAISLGGLYMDQNQMEKAIAYYQMSEQAAEELESVELKEECMNNLVEFYIRKGDPDKAISYMQKLNKLKEEVYSQENSQHIAEAETKFNLAIKNKEIENLRIKNKFAELEAEQAAVYRNVLIVVTCLVLVLSVAIFRNYQLRKRNLKLALRERELIEKEKKMLEQNNELLQNENMLARFEILKSQFCRHFLFNTLNALSYLIEADSEKALQFTTAFSRLYRTILELKDKNLITLEEELQHVESYFFLQQTRFGSSLRIRSEIGAEQRRMLLPPFSIQICMENAINHNVISEKYPLEIYIYTTEHFLFIENNLKEKSKLTKSTSIGIANIKSRYSFFTSEKPEFIKEENKFIVKLPLVQESARA